MSDPSAIVTGGTGLVGRWLVTELTRMGRDVTVIARGGEARAGELRAWVALHGGDATCIGVVDGDLAKEGLGLAPDGRAAFAGAVDVFHLGAVMAFGLDRKTAAEVNVAGTARVYDLASSSPRLRRVVVASGFRAEVAPKRDAAVARLGAYEATKIHADRLATSIALDRGVPTTVARLASVIGDSATGETTQFWGFSDLVRDLLRGRIPFLPGGPRDWMPLVTVDHAARFLARLPEVDGGPIAHHAVLDDATPTFAALARLVADRVGVRAPQRFVPRALARWLVRLRDGAAAEGLSFIGPERYDVASANRAMAQMGIAMPDVVAAVERSVDYLVAHDFGRRDAPASDRAFARAATGAR